MVLQQELPSWLSVQIESECPVCLVLEATENDVSKYLESIFKSGVTFIIVVLMEVAVL